MWLIAPNRLGFAAWLQGDNVWKFEVITSESGRVRGISMQHIDDVTTLTSSDASELPPLKEQFVRGDQLHWSFPQCGDVQPFGFRLVIEPVSSSAANQSVTFQWQVSVETTKLDSHPTLDLVFPQQSASNLSTSSEPLGATFQFHQSGGQTVALLGPQDAPFTAQVEPEASEQALRLRLFGEFLEKGVIRRARPWISHQSSGKDSSGNEGQINAKELLQALAASPLPLD